MKILNRIFAFFAVLLLCFSICSCRVLPGKVFFSEYTKYGNSDRYSVGNFEYDTEKINSVEINWISGEINVIRKDGEKLFVEENSDNLDNDERVHCYIDNGTLIIHFCKSGYKYNHIDDNYKHLTVYIPDNVDLSIDGISADISVSDANLDDLDIDTVSGNVDIGNIKVREISVDSVSGDISIESVNAVTFDSESISGSMKFGDVVSSDTDIDTTSGDVRFDSLKTDTFTADTVSGDIEVENIVASDISVDSVSGKVRLGISEKAVIKIETVSGSVTLDTIDLLGLEVNFSTSSGKIKTQREYVKEKKNVYIFGDAESLVKIKTTSGDLFIN